MTIAGYGIVFDGQDVTGDRFTKATDLWLDGRMSSTPPVLFGHGHDPLMKHTVLGHVVKATADDIGVWIEAKLEASKRYLDAIRKLMARGVPLGWSSGSVPHLVQRTKSATPGVDEITVWPVVEWSIVDTPAEPRTLGVRELKSLAAADPLLLPLAKEAEQVARASHLNDGGASLKDLPDSAFAFIEPGGVLDDERKTTPRANRRLAHHDDEGNVDEDLLRVALAAARKSTDTTTEGFAHLMRHAHGIGLAGPAGHDDAHTKSWSQGAAPALLVVSAKLANLAEEVAAEQTSMAHLGMDTKSNQRIRSEMRQHLREVESDLHRVIDWADAVDRGEDGKARVDLLRQKLALMELEV